MICCSEGNAIRVIIRVRPPGERSETGFEIDNSQCVDVDAQRNCIRMQCKPEPKIFTFDQVCDTATTQV